MVAVSVHVSPGASSARPPPASTGAASRTHASGGGSAGGAVVATTRARSAPSGTVSVTGSRPSAVNV